MVATAAEQEHRRARPPTGTVPTESTFEEQLLAMLRLQPDSSPLPTDGLPVAYLNTKDSGSTSYYVVTTVDHRGRLADRSPLRALQWPPGNPVAMSVLPGAIAVVAQPGSRQAVTRQGHLRLPAALRYGCSINPGDRLLMAALPERSLMLLYGTHVVDEMLLCFHSTQSAREAT